MAALVQGRERAPVVVDRNWPSYRYPPGGNPASGKLFAKEEDVPAGWLDAPSVPAPPPPPPPVKTQAKPKEDDSRWRREAVENAQRLVAAEADASTAQARVRELEAFIEALAAEEKCPPALKRACENLLGRELAQVAEPGGEQIAPEAPKPARKPRAPAS